MRAPPSVRMADNAVEEPLAANTSAGATARTAPLGVDGATPWQLFSVLTKISRGFHFRSRFSAVPWQVFSVLTKWAAPIWSKPNIPASRGPKSGVRDAKSCIHLVKTEKNCQRPRPAKRRRGQQAETRHGGRRARRSRRRLEGRPPPRRARFGRSKLAKSDTFPLSRAARSSTRIQNRRSKACAILTLPSRPGRQLTKDTYHSRYRAGISGKVPDFARIGLYFRARQRRCAGRTQQTQAARARGCNKHSGNWRRRCRRCPACGGNDGEAGADSWRRARAQAHPAVKSKMRAAESERRGWRWRLTHGQRGRDARRSTCGRRGTRRPARRACKLTRAAGTLRRTDDRRAGAGAGGGCGHHAFDERTAGVADAGRHRLMAANVRARGR